MTSSVTCFLDLTDLGTYAALEQIVTLSADDTITWQPLLVSLNRASGRKPDATTDDPLAAYKARRQRARDSFAASEHARLLALTGVRPDVADRSREGERAHRCLYHLSMHDNRARVVTFVRDVMTGTFRDGMDMEDMDWLRSLSGLQDDPPAIPDAVADHQMEQGIFKSPAWLIDGERYLGREHFPMMRHLLTRAEGTAPV